MFMVLGEGDYKPWGARTAHGQVVRGSTESGRRVRPMCALVRGGGLHRRQASAPPICSETPPSPLVSSWLYPVRVIESDSISYAAG